MSRQSVAKAHQKIQELSWEPAYHTPVSQYGTDYTFQKAKKKDPLKQVLRSYFPMQEEKDHRVYGAEDGAIRGNMFRQVQERWLEWQKLFLSIIPLPEISAARAMPLLFRTVPNPELHNGQAIQMIDEVRHSTIQQNLKRLYMNNYIDPAGFNSSLRNFQNDYCGTIGRQFAEGFITGDAITAASIYLTIVAETAFTNTLFVAMPAEAAANGDYLLPTVFHSVQSDESRHISNGYATLLMALSDECNHQLLERDLRYAWWNNHRVVDAAIGTFIEYGTKDRRKDRESYAEMWRRWIYDDYYRSYLVPLEKYGLVIPHDLIEESWNQIWNKGYVHEVAQFFATGWLANYWRIDPMTDTDFEWFEYKYPGWYDKYGKWWENYNRLSDPERAQPDRRGERRLRVPAPLLDVHGAVPGPRGHGRGQGRRPVADVLPRGLPLDRRRGVPAHLPGSQHAEHGQAHRCPRVGDALPRLELGRRASRTWASCVTTARPWSRSHIWTSTRRRCGRSTTCAACPRLLSPNVLLNKMDDKERAAFVADYNRQGPAGRPAPRRRLTATGAPGEDSARHYRSPLPVPPTRGSGPSTGEGKRWQTSTWCASSRWASRSRSSEDQTILRAAAEQGIMLMHGCKEGQCASCKSFILDGDDVELDQYSTFALPEFEKDEGYTLLCRAHAYEDLTIELLNYDEEMIHSGLPIQHAVVEVESNENVTHDMRHLVVRLVEPTTLRFFPGQYVDFTIPGTDWTRSFSMANTSSMESGRLEFVIKVYPDGVFSEFLDTEVSVGDRLEIDGPFGMFTLRDAPDKPLVFLGGGAGMAPVLCLLRAMAERGIDRPATYYYGARRRRDLCFEKELAALSDSCRVPVRAGAVRARGRRGLGRRGRADHRRGAQAGDRTSRPPTRTCAARRRWSRRRSSCCPSSAWPRSESSTTSSPRPATPK